MAERRRSALQIFAEGLKEEINETIIFINAISLDCVSLRVLRIALCACVFQP